MIRPAILPLLVFLASCGPSEGQVATGDAGALGARPEAPQATPAPGGDGPHRQERLPPPGHAWVIFGADTVLAEVARTPQEREQGLMYRESLPKGTGMLFVFPDSQIRSFWMSNTFIPLDIAYIDSELKIVDIQAMEPETLDSHPSAAPAMFALEVPQGWFQEMEIRVGAQAQVVFGPG